jgi:monofunctional biosynthetic peptidoglycan transglycosylase
LFSVAARTIAALVVGGLLLGVVLVLPLRWLAPPWTAMMVEQPGPLSAVRYAWVDRRAIAATAATAVIAAEDQKFLEHHGFDFDSINRALEDHEDGDALRGASTISQQVAKNVFLWPGRSFVRKGIEAYLTVLLELFCSKQRILELYLNVAELGPGVFGVEAAARRYFGAPAAALSAPQAALLAAVLPNPRRLRVDKPSAYVRGRQAWVLAQMRVLEARGHYRGLDW